MMRSLLAQLLRLFPYATVVPLPKISLQDIEGGDILKICELFSHIVRHLPLGTSVFSVIDGINEYEREEYLHTMDKVIFSLLELIKEGSAAHFKLLLTSPRPTEDVRNVFDERGTLLHTRIFLPCWPNASRGYNVPSTISWFTPQKSGMIHSGAVLSSVGLVRLKSPTSVRPTWQENTVCNRSFSWRTAWGLLYSSNNSALRWGIGRVERRAVLVSVSCSMFERI